MTKEPVDQLDLDIIERRTRLRENPSHISYRLKIPLQEVYRRMGLLGLKTNNARKIEDYESVKEAVAQGLSFKVVAGKFHVSEERIRYLATKWGFEHPKNRPIDDELVVHRYVNLLQSAEQIHEELGYGIMRIRRRLKELGVARSMAETKKARTRCNDHLVEGGYPLAKIPEGHVTRHRKHGTSDYAPAYIIEMEKKLERPLAKEEIVHHIDLDKTNCSIDNLYLCANNSEHFLLHRSMEPICRDFIKEGKIVFDGKRYRRLEDLKKKGIE